MIVGDGDGLHAVLQLAISLNVPDADMSHIWVVALHAYMVGVDDLHVVIHVDRSGNGPDEDGSHVWVVALHAYFVDVDGGLYFSKRNAHGI